MYDSTSICQCGCGTILNARGHRTFVMGHKAIWERQMEAKKATWTAHFWKQHGKALSLYKKETCCICDSNELLRIHPIGSIDDMSESNWVTVCAKCKRVYRFKMYIKRARGSE